MMDQEVNPVRFLVQLLSLFNGIFCSERLADELLLTYNSDIAFAKYNQHFTVKTYKQNTSTKVPSYNFEE